MFKTEDMDLWLREIENVSPLKGDSSRPKSMSSAFFLATTTSPKPKCDKSLWEQVTLDVSKNMKQRRNDRYASPVYIRPTPQPNPFTPVIDLHGMTLCDAHNATVAFIQMAERHSCKTVTVITGRSGSICGEFPAWCESIPAANAVVLNNNGGSYTVKLR